MSWIAPWAATQATPPRSARGRYCWRCSLSPAGPRAAPGRADPTRRRAARPLLHSCARAVLWLALAVQASWVILDSLTWHRPPGLDVPGVIVLATFIAFAALHRRPRWCWLAVLARTLMAAELLLAVGDRFGLLGPPGAAGVSWGDFGHFVDYTRSITTFLPGRLAPALAVLATIAELALGAALLLGLRLRLAALGTALLLGVYGTSMMISRPAADSSTSTCSCSARAC